MINIFTLKVGKKYSSRYVNNLFRGIKKFSNCDFNFYCYTEDSKELDNNIIVVPLKKPDLFKLQWHKLIFHKNNFAGVKTGEKCLILDIDWIIINDVNDILNHNFNKDSFVCFERWWSKKKKDCLINGGFQMFHMGDTDHLWQKFIEDPSYWQEYYVSNGLAEGPVNGEQNFIDNHINIKRQYLPKEWFGKYYDKEMDYIQSRWLYYIDKHSVFYLNEFFDERVKMIHFANANNLIENYKENWIKAHWE